MNKYNLYNISRLKDPYFQHRTFFQQKWTSKAVTRAYHGETVKEKQWTRLFRPGIRSVVPMDYKRLAQDDGSEAAAGRGSGLQPEPGRRQRELEPTPYMNMVYAATERRLDTAIFRALFASSTRQARQFVVHGNVKVNGKKMIYPSYQLNPGDMFQVEPDCVLYATGAPKDKIERRATRLAKKAANNEETEVNEDAHSGASPAEDTSELKSSSEKPPSDPKQNLTSLLNSAKTLLASPSQTLSAKQKQSLRAFQSTLKRTISRPTSLTDSIEAQMIELSAKLGITPPSLHTTPTTPIASAENLDESVDSASQAPQSFSMGHPKELSKDDAALLAKALQEARDNPVDPAKPYATPWRPREWMSAFAFVPRYLEVHHKVCSAVYLRHPVARPGLAEVPGPFGQEVYGLAHNWYLRRR